MRKKSSEVWVGVFVIIGIVLLVAMTLKIEKFQFGKEKGYLLSVLLRFGSSIRSEFTGESRWSPYRECGKDGFGAGKGKSHFPSSFQHFPL